MEGLGYTMRLTWDPNNPPVRVIRLPIGISSNLCEFCVDMGVKDRSASRRVNLRDGSYRLVCMAHLPEGFKESDPVDWVK